MRAPAQALEAARLRLKALNVKIRRFADMANEAKAPQVFYGRIAQMEAERAEVERGLVELERENAERTVLAAITERDVLAILDNLAVSLEGINPGRMKDLLVNLTERVVLDPADLSCRIHYKFPAVRGECVASPRGFEPLYSP